MESTRRFPEPAGEPSRLDRASFRGTTVDSASLFAGHDEVVIRHNGRDYRLRRTRLGKLILTA